jgi:hypothetical protein
MLQVQAGGRRETPSVQLSRLQSRERRDLQKEGAKNTKDHNGKGVLFKLYHARSVLLGGCTKQRGAAAAAASSTPGSCGRASRSGKTECPGSCAAARRRSVRSGSRCKQFTSAQHIQSNICSTADCDSVLWCCVTESKNSGHYKHFLESNKAELSQEFIGPLNSNGIGRQRHEISKQLQGLQADGALFSEIYLKSHERFFIPNYHFYRNCRCS